MLHVASYGKVTFILQCNQVHRSQIVTTRHLLLHASISPSSSRSTCDMPTVYNAMVLVVYLEFRTQ